MLSRKKLLEACDLIERQGGEGVASGQALADLEASGNFDIRREVRSIRAALKAQDLTAAEKKAKNVWSVSHIRMVVREFPE